MNKKSVLVKTPGKVFTIDCNRNPIIPRECKKRIQYDGVLGKVEFRMEDLLLIPAYMENRGRYVELPSHFLDFFEEYPELMECIPTFKNPESWVAFRAIAFQAIRGARLFPMFRPGENGKKWERGTCAVGKLDPWDFAIVMRV
jgi:hypothetical protein